LLSQIDNQTQSDGWTILPKVV